MARTRLDPDRRRDRLMDVGVDAFAVHAYDDVTMNDIARTAGVSRALLYHYFPTKREFFSSLWKRAHDGLLESAVFDADEPLVDQIERALRAHYDFYEANAGLVMIANRSEISSDPLVRDPVMEDLNLIRHRILDAAGLSGRAEAIASAGLAGWIAFVREVGVEWLHYRRLTQEDAIELCMTALTGAIGSRASLSQPPLRFR